MTLTPRETELLTAIKRLTVYGVSPTYDQLAFAMGLASKSGVSRMLDSLERRGRIRRVRYTRNSIEIINPLSVEIARLKDIYGAEAVKAEVAR